MNATVNKAVPDGMKSWLLACSVVLIVSLVLLTGNLVAGFYFFSDMKMPVWVSILGAVAMLGVVAGFGGVFLLMAAAAVKDWHKGRRHIHH